MAIICSKVRFGSKADIADLASNDGLCAASVTRYPEYGMIFHKPSFDDAAPAMPSDEGASRDQRLEFSSLGPFGHISRATTESRVRR